MPLYTFKTNAEISLNAQISTIFIINFSFISGGQGAEEHALITPYRDVPALQWLRHFKDWTLKNS